MFQLKCFNCSNFKFRFFAGEPGTRQSRSMDGGHASGGWRARWMEGALGDGGWRARWTMGMQMVDGGSLGWSGGCDLIFHVSNVNIMNCINNRHIAIHTHNILNT